MFQFYRRKPDEVRTDVIGTHERCWASAPGGGGLWVATLSPVAWDLVSRHGPTVAALAGRRWTAAVLDLTLNASRPSQDPGAGWVPIEPTPA